MSYMTDEQMGYMPPSYNHNGGGGSYCSDRDPAVPWGVGKATPAWPFPTGLPTIDELCKQAAAPLPDKTPPMFPAMKSTDQIMDDHDAVLDGLNRWLDEAMQRETPVPMTFVAAQDEIVKILKQLEKDMGVIVSDVRLEKNVGYGVCTRTVVIDSIVQNQYVWGS